MIDLILAAYIATAKPIKIPAKKEKIEVSRHIDIIKPDDLFDYYSLIKRQSK
jgi:hypothetical protein